MIKVLMLAAGILLISMQTIECQIGDIDLSKSQSNSSIHQVILNSKLSSVRSVDFDCPPIFDKLNVCREATLRAFPLSLNSVGNIKVTRSRSVVDANTKCIVPSVIDGRVVDQIVPAPQSIVFRGVIDGQAGSKVIMVFVGEELFCSINHADGSSYVLGPSSMFALEGANYVLMSSADFPSIDLSRQKDCGSAPTRDYQMVSKQGTTNQTQASTLLECELALETDSEFFKAADGDTKLAQAYAIALVSMLSELYAEQVNVVFYLKWLKTWTSSPADPYDVKGDGYALSAKVLPYWKANYSKVERDAAHVMTSIGYGGGGFGYYDGLCGKAGDYSFSVSSVQGRHRYPTFAFTYDVYIFAHEIGHNFNATHTHSCASGIPLDTCIVEEAISGGCLTAGTKPKPNRGSVMSYCGGTNNSAGLGYIVAMEFHDFNRKEIRKTAESATCLEETVAPTIKLTSLRGGAVLKPNELVDVTWTSARVSQLSIEFTIDDGKNWETMAGGIAAGFGIWSIKVPDICTNNFKVRVIAIENDSVFDTSTFPNQIVKVDSSGLVAFYPFNASLADEQDCHLYPLSSTGTFTDDRFGIANSALLCDGATSVSNSSMPFDSDQMTFTFWFKPTSYDGEQTILGTNWKEQAIIQTYVWGQFGVAYWAGSGTPGQSWGGSPSLNQWHFGAIWYDGYRIVLYIDGVSVSNQSLGSPINKSKSAAFYVGGRKNEAFFKGALDDIRYYRKALSHDELLALKNEKAVSVEVTFEPKFSVYPNPAEDKLTVALSNPNSTATLFITSLLGERIFTSKLVGQTAMVSPTALPAGAYQVMVCVEGKCSSQMIVIGR